MKRLLLFAMLAAGSALSAQRGFILPPATPRAATPDIPAAVSAPAFPLRIHLITARWGGTSGVYHGYGSGNLLLANGPQGFDYGFQCGAPFVQNQGPDDTYQARWTRSPYQLEILTSEVGGSQPRTHTCVLHLALKNRPSDPANTPVLSNGVSSSLRVRWQDPDFAYVQPAPDYPVQFHVVDGRRKEDGYGDHGWGTGNIYDPSVPGVLQGADYTYDCARGFLTSSEVTGYYPGQWTTLGSQLEVLLQRAGSNKVDRCRVQVNLRPQPYPEAHRTVARAQAVSASAAWQTQPGNP
jgi:hypothetical protein